MASDYNNIYKYSESNYFMSENREPIIYGSEGYQNAVGIYRELVSLTSVPITLSNLEEAKSMLEEAKRELPKECQEEGFTRYIIGKLETAILKFEGPSDS